MKDTLTVALEGGVISLDKFTAALQATLRMVNALATEVALGSGPIEWVIDGLDRGSATATVRGQSQPGEEETVELVVAAFGDVARSLESHERITRSRGVVTQARRFERLLDDTVTEIRIETPDRNASIRREAATVAVEAQLRQSYGAVRGRIQTLTTRGSLRFTLYDAVDDKAVSCYLQEDQRDLMRGLWDRMAVVEAMVRRDSFDFHELVASEARRLVRQAVSNGWSLKPMDAIHLATAGRIGADALQTYDPALEKYSTILGLPIEEPVADSPMLALSAASESVADAGE